jgi:excisionase family DNA binding protein
MMTPERVIIPTMENRRLLGIDKAAVYLDATPRTVQRMIQRGLLRPVRLAGLRRVLIDRDDLDQMIDAAKEAAV